MSARLERPVFRLGAEALWPGLAAGKLARDLSHKPRDSRRREPKNPSKRTRPRVSSLFAQLRTPGSEGPAGRVALLVDVVAAPVVNDQLTENACGVGIVVLVHEPDTATL